MSESGKHNGTTEIVEYSLLSTKNPVFCCYLFWCGILVVKMLLMSIITNFRRITSKTFANPEDVNMNKTTEVKFNNPGVERVRRAHRNDLENVLPYLLISLAYVATGPGTIVACILMRIAAVSRVIHTGVYAFYPVPQPARGIAFFVTFFISIFMAFYVMVKTARHI